MLSIRTTKCNDFGQPELVLAFDPAKLLEADAHGFANGLERMVQSGSCFQAGQSLQIGWSMAWFVTLPDNTLGFEEPNMKSMPIVRQPGLTTSQPDGADSGWFIGCQADEHDHNDPSTLRCLSLYEAVVTRCPHALAYLAFPPGATIALDEAPSFFMQGEPLVVRKGSFVDAQLSRIII